ncbi:hypothetical protein QJS10_CPB15g01775 [Acorus calamus]|uniref:Uncharacterized protein n=1 Tax=Acorus calamus TaxID=4465 RepID=A0AAV9D4K4_ACOCL|nr:hypothetical protein QJS10_CPB15g01775 [Acorus calamus]
MAFTESRDEASSLPVQKARSTAEEFNKHAKEMADSVAHNAKEAFEGAKEAVVGESEHDNEKFKEKVEKGLMKCFTFGFIAPVSCSKFLGDLTGGDKIELTGYGLMDLFAPLLVQLDEDDRRLAETLNVDGWGGSDL